VICNEEDSKVDGRAKLTADEERFYM